LEKSNGRDLQELHMGIRRGQRSTNPRKLGEKEGENSHVPSWRRGYRSTGKPSGYSDGEAERRRRGEGGMTDGDEGAEVSVPGCEGGGAASRGAGGRRQRTDQGRG
jgi:hypothetical protein